jgi:hypothetical protein
VHHNFTKLPPVRSERPVWDFHHPDAVTIRHGGNGHGHLGTGADRTAGAARD